jgi:hypothetical protein
MHQVTTGRTGLSAAAVKDALLAEVGGGCRARLSRTGAMRFRRGVTQRAVVAFDEEGSSTTFEVSGEGLRLPIPFLYLATQKANDAGIARELAEVIRHQFGA